MDWNQFWTSFGRVDNFLGVATIVFAAYTAFRLWQQNKQLMELAKKSPPVENFEQLLALHQGVKSSNPMAFALSLVPSSEYIKRAVEQFLQSQGWKMPVKELNMNGINTAKDLEAFVNVLHEKRRYFEATGCTELHLFIQGPVQAGTIGSNFRHWIPVKLYHRPNSQPPQIYEYWMPLI
jgi:hypothetical protein